MKQGELKLIASKPVAVMLPDKKIRIERHIAEDVIFEYYKDSQEMVFDLVNIGFRVDFSLIKEEPDFIIDRFKNRVKK
jgi:hypothetical protein